MVAPYPRTYSINSTYRHKYVNPVNLKRQYFHEASGDIDFSGRFKLRGQ